MFKRVNPKLSDMNDYHRENFSYWLNTARKSAQMGDVFNTNDCIHKATMHATHAGANDLIKIVDAERDKIILDAYTNAIPIKLKAAEVLARDSDKEKDGVKFEGYLYTSYNALEAAIGYAKKLKTETGIKQKVAEILNILQQKGLDEKLVKELNESAS